MAEVWKFINKKRRKKVWEKANIRKEVWKKHFMESLDGTVVQVDDGYSNNPRESSRAQ